ncbi:efflux RND transporter periplasmic adaptor subunit [Photobacterium sanguinicancri]|uniref:efflux RND transporter periplasmic adaptor subunit n=1 Tax=Photobacterium sanguinicancri TaxID=875932 RepID=UPI003CCC1FE3
MMKLLSTSGLFTIGLTAILVSGCDKAAVEPRVIAQPIKISTVSLANAAPLLTFPAVAAAADKSSLSFRIQGEVTKVLIRPGALVKKGQLLAELEPTDYQLEVDDALAKYNVADSQYRRSAKLVDKGYIAQSQFDELRAQRSIARARLDLARLRLTFTKLRAPFSGVISKVPIEEFENVQVGQQVMNIHSTKQVDIHIQAPDMVFSQRSAVDIERDRPNARVVMPDGVEYRAKLKEFTTELDPDSGTFLVTLTMPMPSDRFILDGMAVEVKADAQKLKIYQAGEPVVPVEAIFNEDGDGIEQANKFVWVVNTDNTVTKRQITTDKVVPEGVRILSGVTEGEQIVIAGGNRLRDGQSVIVVDEEDNQP